MRRIEFICYKENNWYKSLSEQGKYVADKIFDYYDYYRIKDNKFRNFVYIFRISIFFFAMLNTINLGINIISGELQINIGLILSAVITFLTTMATFFNFDQYWMNNKIMFIELCKIKNNFIFEVNSNQMDEENCKKYIDKLNKINDKNKKYWKISILRLR
jgi:hypothetical protein